MFFVSIENKIAGDFNKIEWLFFTFKHYNQKTIYMILQRNNIQSSNKLQISYIKWFFSSSSLLVDDSVNDFGWSYCCIIFKFENSINFYIFVTICGDVKSFESHKTWTMFNFVDVPFASSFNSHFLSYIILIV